MPTNFHFKITREALQAGKHVLCEKPLALDAQECLTLGDLASLGKVLMVGHIFVFNQGIVKLREYIASGEMGKIHYAHSERTNLGPFRYDVNALWDLAPHDISIFNFFFNSAPVSVSARGHKCLGGNLEDLGFATIDYPDNIMVNVHVSWLDPKRCDRSRWSGARKWWRGMTWMPKGPLNFTINMLRRLPCIMKLTENFNCFPGREASPSLKSVLMSL